ncbi:MAG TPA: serine/threonine-protein kinase [Thermoanaerobaculia bacterium]|jgi:WD40 repeat protein/tRNA A-37 threonylcarbamoyl transferase component Bud32|nr:serine/threonine-protein kinase [Thermoanaerobaculia bacterium]
METARWTRIEELLQAALDLDPAARAAFLAEACGSDDNLRHAVDALLARERERSLLSAFPGTVLSTPTAVPLTGQTIGHYAIGARIGKGGMGEVYEARDERLQRIVALKTLPAELTDDEDRVQRFEREALTVSRLNHPNIITIFEIIRDGEAHFIATERVEGQTLRNVLIDPQTGGPRPLPLEQALDIVTQIAAALKAAHTAWIIHRDIKPENIMIREDGLVKVLDFGIAKLNDEPSDGPHVDDHATHSNRADGLTVPGAILGTAKYMSPEQSRGEALDGRTDLFSLGMVFYEMLTGTRYAATDDPAPRALDRLPGELQRIVRKLLRIDRQERYPSAGELLDDLDRVKRRMFSRTARRMAGLSAIAVAAAVGIVAIAAMLSVNESWEERILRDGHRAAARQAVFSPDGRLLVSCGEDGQVIVWDFARRERLGTLDGPAAHKLAYSSDGRWLAAGGVDGSITVWDASRRVKLQVLRDVRQEIGALTFSPDGTILASSTGTGELRTVLWSTDGWKKIAEWPNGGQHGTFLFPPGMRQIVLTAGWNLYDRATRRVSQLDVTANWAALSPDGAQLVTIDPIGEVAFHRLDASADLSRPELITSQRAHQDHGRAIAFSPDGRLAASGAEVVVLWDAVSHRKIARFEHNAVVWSLAFSPDGRSLVSSHADGALLVWDIAERELVANLSEHSGAVRSVAFSPDGRRAVSGGEDRSVTIWNAETGLKEAVLAGHETRVTSVAFTGDGGRIASGDQDGLIILWDPLRRQARWTTRPDRWAALYALAFSPDGRFLASSNGLYAADDGKTLSGFRAGWPYGSIYGIAYSPDGRRIACVTDGGWVLLLDGRSGRLLEKQQVPATDQISVDLSADGKWLVTGEDEGAVRLWSVAPLRQTAILGRHTARVKSVAFSPDGETVASAGDDKIIALWDVGRRKLRARIGTHASPIYSIAFSSDGRRLISGEHDRSVRIYTRRRSLWGIRLD